MSKRFVCDRKKTGKVRVRRILRFIQVIEEEVEVLTCLPSHDITDEYHIEWDIIYHRFINPFR